ncbi:MAG: FAD-binding protein [Opitutaceae bacterium]
MTLLPESYEEAAEAVRSCPLIAAVGAGSKPALARAPAGCARLGLGKLAGMVDYDPAEFTFTARAGTPLREIEAELGRHGQYLPFDPPFAEEGATVGGTLAAGLSGAGRYRFGGVRDFILGVRFVTGLGELVRAGSKVVKNAAGFDLPKLMVGSLGRLGIVVEASFKVFPRPRAYATLVLEGAALADALELAARLTAAPFDLESVELLPPGSLALRIAGYREGLAGRLDRLEGAAGRKGVRRFDGDDREYWRALAPRGPGRPDELLLRIGLTPPDIPPLDAALERVGAVRRYSVGGQIAWVRASAGVEDVHAMLLERRLTGLLLAGPGDRVFVGAPVGRAFAAKLKSALDPENRFLPLL